PVTVLSGFLGAGKTTLLQKMLSGKGGLKVGVVVNDLAAINIDSKLVKTDGIRQKVQQDGSGVDTDVIEMQNGCACCSASDDLIESLGKLLLVAAERGEKFDRLVIEGSGVTEPKNIRKQFFELELVEHPITQYCKLQNMITVVDSGNFLPIYNSADPLLLKSELVEESALEMQAMRKVASLLTEQVEVADYILLNKQDTVTPEKNEELKAVVNALNPTATVLPCSYGDVDVGVVFGSKKKQWAAEGDEEMDFKRTVAQIQSEMSAACSDPDCKDPTHKHSVDPTHKHSVVAKEECKDADCKDPTHKHSVVAKEECSDPNCNDPTHSHSKVVESPQSKFGITSFVYSRRRPFDTERVKAAIMKLPIVGNPAIDNEEQDHENKKSPMFRVLRSKGFMWVSTKHDEPLFWSQAGRFFELKDFGKFWASTDLRWWPDDEISLRDIARDFGGPENKWGDRRQEIVFIGPEIDRAGIETILDECL
ncbi:hypothetical protein GUITHDRAFT_57042, partial [Guillardia theta CCMP2712]